ALPTDSPAATCLQLDVLQYLLRNELPDDQHDQLLRHRLPRKPDAAALPQPDVLRPVQRSVRSGDERRSGRPSAGRSHPSADAQKLMARRIGLRLAPDPVRAFTLRGQESPPRFLACFVLPFFSSGISPVDSCNVMRNSNRSVQLDLNPATSL